MERFSCDQCQQVPPWGAPRYQTWMENTHPGRVMDFCSWECLIRWAHAQAGGEQPTVPRQPWDLQECSHLGCPRHVTEPHEVQFWPRWQREHHERQMRARGLEPEPWDFPPPEEYIPQLQAQVAALEQERDAVQAALAQAQQEAKLYKAVSDQAGITHFDQTGTPWEEIQHLQAQLAQAQHKVAKLEEYQAAYRETTGEMFEELGARIRSERAARERYERSLQHHAHHGDWCAWAALATRTEAGDE